jgi:hypothetical protein
MSGLEKFIAYAERARLPDRLPRGGIFLKSVPRILGQGKSSIEGALTERPPALIERLAEYAKLDLQRLCSEVSFPIADGDPIWAEQAAAQTSIKKLSDQLTQADGGWQRSAREVLYKLGNHSSGRGPRFAIDDIELGFDQRSLTWKWTYRGSYNLVSKIPHDIELICEVFADAKAQSSQAILPPDQFLSSLKLAWLIASQRSPSGTVLIRDVAKTYVVAGQAATFWEKPSKTNFCDIGEAVFVINLVQAIDEVRKLFDLDRAGIHQTSLGGKGKDVSFDLPKPGGGMQPYSTIRLKS